MEYSGAQTVITPVGFLVTPAGRQTTLDTLPLGAAASAGGNNKIRVYTVDGAGALTEQAALPLPTVNPDGK
jgi:hypothetical protein